MENAKNQDKGLIFQERFNELVGNSTQEEIAQKLNTSRQNVGNWKKGKSRPDIFALAEISKAYNVSTDYLLGLTDIKSTDTTIQSVCEYIHCGEDVIETIRSIYDELDIYNEEEKDSYIRDLNFLNNILSSQLFKELIDNIFWAECMADNIYINPASILSTEGYTDFNAWQIQERAEQCLGISDLGVSKEYVFRLIINRSVEKSKDLSSYKKNIVKNEFENFIQQADHTGLDCDVSRYNANKTLEKLLNQVDSREKIYKYNTKKQWLNYLQITEQDVEDSIKAVENAETAEELLKIGAISEKEYELGVRTKKELDEERRKFELEQQKIEDEIERLEKISNN